MNFVVEVVGLQGLLSLPRLISEERGPKFVGVALLEARVIGPKCLKSFRSFCGQIMRPRSSKIWPGLLLCFLYFAFGSRMRGEGFSFYILGVWGLTRVRVTLLLVSATVRARPS